MEKNERQDLELEGILQELEETVEAASETDAMADAAFVEWLKGEPEEEAPQAVSQEPEEAQLDDILPEWLSNGPKQEEREESPEQAPEEPLVWEPAAELQETRRIEPVGAEDWMPEIDLQQTRRMEPVQTEEVSWENTGDTIRLDELREEFAALAQKQAQQENTEEARIWNPADTIRSEPFSERWEPEYEQPMGEYVPPQPIVFQSRSRLHELKKKLVAGPEKRFYDLTGKGVGKLQAAIFLSVLVVLICAASTVMYAAGMVQENRMRLMVFGQFLAMLVSALLGSYQLIEGVMDLAKKKFTLNTLLAVTFLVCCVDGVLCLRQVRVPCCAAFSLEMTMSLWSTYQRRSTEISQMDTMRKATRLDGVTARPDYLDGKKGLLRIEGQVEDFMDHYAETGKPEKALNVYGLIAMCLALAIGIVAGVLAGFSAGVQVAAVSLLAAAPATIFISQSRPVWILERRLHRLGTVLCGWQGVEGLSGKAVFPVTFDDLYPLDAVRLNGMKFFGSREPDLVVAYATAVITADNGGLSGLFTHLLDSHNGRHYDACNLTHYENGGVCGVVDGETVLLGAASFLKDMDVEVPDTARVSNGMYVAIDGELSGLFALSYEKTRSAAAGLTTLGSYRALQCVLTSDDFMLTQGFLKSKFGVKPKRFLLPDHDVREQLRKLAPEEGAAAMMVTTATGLAPVAYGVTGARVLKTTCRLGMVLHMVGGAVGLGIMVLLVALQALQLLTPANMFLYQLAWMIPALLITEWTRSI